MLSAVFETAIAGRTHSPDAISGPTEVMETCCNTSPPEYVPQFRIAQSRKKHEQLRPKFIGNGGNMGTTTDMSAETDMGTGHQVGNYTDQ